LFNKLYQGSCYVEMLDGEENCLLWQQAENWD
jgi:hypothetical protein